MIYIKFYSDIFPNLEVITGKNKVKFKNGVYETEDVDIIKALMDLDFRTDLELEDDIFAEDDIDTEDDIGEEPKSEKQKHEIPVSWTKTKVLEYAKKQGIYNDAMEDLKRKDLIDYIESL